MGMEEEMAAAAVACIRVRSVETVREAMGCVRWAGDWTQEWWMVCRQR